MAWGVGWGFSRKHKGALISGDFGILKARFLSFPFSGASVPGWPLSFNICVGNAETMPNTKEKRCFSVPLLSFYCVLLKEIQPITITSLPLHY